MNSTATPEGPGSVSGAPRLPDGFADTFTSRYLDAAGSGHWVAEQAPEQLVEALAEFLAPYRDGGGAAHDARPRAAATS